MEELRSTIERDSENIIQKSSRLKIESVAVRNMRVYILTCARMITSYFK